MKKSLVSGLWFLIFALSADAGNLTLISGGLDVSNGTINIDTTNRPAITINKTNPVVTADQLGSIAGMNNLTPAGGALSGTFSNLAINPGAIAWTMLDTNIQKAVSNALAGVGAPTWPQIVVSNYQNSAQVSGAVATGTTSLINRADANASFVSNSGALPSITITPGAWDGTTNYNVEIRGSDNDPAGFGNGMAGQVWIHGGVSYVSEPMSPPGVLVISGSDATNNPHGWPGSVLIRPGYSDGEMGYQASVIVTNAIVYGTSYGTFIGDGGGLTNIPGGFLSIGAFQATITNYWQRASFPTGQFSTGTSGQMALGQIGGTGAVWNAYRWTNRWVTPGGPWQ